MKHAALNTVALVLAVFATSSGFAAERKPNVVLIYVDDLGYGDVGCYGATKVKTPNVDRLAREGLKFTDGHSSSASCTPSRYALLTGEYPWRRKGTGVLPGDAALIIEPGRPTLASVLKDAGYQTGVVGKWHLGLGAAGKELDWNGVIKPGPPDIGFDYSFIIPATGDRVPCVYVENYRVAGLDESDPIRVNYEEKVGDEPTGKENPDLLKMKLTAGHDRTIVNGISRIGWMTGGKSARWVDENMADDITAKAVDFIERRKEMPFFLFFSTHDIHVPRVPHPRFAGTSGMGPRGDAIHQMDWCVGQITDTLDRLNLTNDTLVIFSSDNGPVLDDGYADDAKEKLGDHKPAGPLRGGKYSPYEGGTRVPFIVRWPAKVKAGTTSDALVCQIDLMRSLSSLTGARLTEGAAPDSEDVRPALLGESQKGRDQLVQQGRRIAYRHRSWKLIEQAGGEPRDGGTVDLYDLANDPAETKNLALQQPEKVKELAQMLAKVRAGR